MAVQQENRVSFNWHKVAGTTRQETAAQLDNTYNREQLRNNQLIGWNTSKKPGFNFKPTTQKTIEAMAKPKKDFVFGAKSPSNQPALTALTQKELFGFGAESSLSQSTPNAPEPEVCPRESFPPRLPAVLLQTTLMGHRPAGASGRSSK